MLIRSELEGQEAVRPVPRLHLPQEKEAFEEQSRAGQQDHGHRRLCDHEQAAMKMPPGHFPKAGDAVLEHVVHIGPRGLQCRAAPKTKPTRRDTASVNPSTAMSIWIAST